MRKTTAIISAILTISLIFNVYAVLTGTFTIPTTGTLSTDLKLAVYEDRDCTILCETIEWGHVEKNVQQIKAVFVKNENTVPIAISGIAENWNPAEVETYATFEAIPYGDPNLASGEVKELDFHLTVSGDYLGMSDFTFDIVITGTEIT